MKTTRKILLALVLTLAVAAVMSVCAFAFDVDTDLPKGVTNTDAKWVDSGYTDVDTEEGWYLIGMNGSDYSTTETSYPTFASIANARFYWHKETNRAVWLVVSANMSGNSGEEGVVSLKNVSDSTKKKFYAYASCFVDVTNTANNAFKTHFASSTDEKTQYVTQSASKYPIYESYITAGKASKQWSNVYVTADAYAAFVEYKAGLGYAEDENVTVVADQDKLVEYAYTNIAPYKNLVNCLENGAKFNMAWVFKQLASNNLPFTALEFRVAKGVSSPYYGTTGLVNATIEATKVLFDSQIDRIALTNTNRGLFIGNSALKTLDHVTFEEDGTYAETVTDNVVDLSGFNTATAYTISNVTYYSSQLLKYSGMEKIVWFGSIKSADTENAGVFDVEVLSSATSLTEIVVPASVTLEQIKAKAFSGCTALKTIDIKGTVSADLKIDASAFTGVSGLTIKVYSDIDKANMEAALATAGVTATVETTKVDDTGDGDTVSIPSVITADGFMLRTSSYNGLRALFTFNETKAEAVASETGYTLIEYGAIASSAANYETAGSGEDLLAKADGKKIQRIVIFADDDTGLNKYVDVDAKQYCIAVRDFAGANTLKDIYVAGYALWSNGTDTVITISEYTTKTGKNTISLYTLTLEMYKAGVVNAQNTDDVCLWQVLKNGALSVTEDETKAPADTLDLTVGYEYDEDGKFTYVDLPLRAWNMYLQNGAVQWNSCGVTVEATATTGVLWSILTDGDNLVVVYRADPAAETSTLPKLSDAYGASAPYSSKYFTPKTIVEDASGNGLLKTATIYSPIVTDENSDKIKTIVIDYGVDKFGDQSLATASVTTVVYPEGMTSGNYLLNGAKGLRNMIYATADKSYLDEYDVDSLVDLTGLARVSFFGITYNASSVENVLLPTVDKIAGGEQYGFGGSTALMRVWMVGDDMPEAGVIDLSSTKITTICKGFFDGLNNITDVYMPETFKTISAWSLTAGGNTDTARWLIFGNNSSSTKLNIHVASWDGLNVIANTFYDARQDINNNDDKEGDPNNIAHIVDYLKITYNDVTKTVLEWRADFPAQPAE